MNFQWPWYLLGILLLGLPWLLHLFSRHFAPERPFPSKQFLEAAEPPKSRTQQLQYKLLFALRALMLLALCALFAMPWINREQQARDVAHIDYLVLDHSLSMQSEGRWDSALELMDTHLDALAPDALNKLFTFDGNLKELSRGELSAPGYLRADYGDLIRQLDARAENEEVPVRVTFITDAQQSSVPAHRNALLFGSIEQLTVKRVAELDTINFSLTAEARSFDGVHAHIKIMLSASSASDSEQIQQRTIQVSQGERVVASQEINLMAGERRELVLEQIPLPASNDNVFNVQLLEEDALPQDNQLLVVAVGSNPEPVSIIQYSDSASPAAMVFLDTALRSDGVASMSLATETDLISGDAISHVVAFIGQEDGDTLPVSLENFIKAGGNALLVMVPATNNGEVDKGSAVTYIDQVHALALGRSDWSSVNLFSSSGYQVVDNEQVLLRSASGEALLLERTMDNGRLFILRDALDGSSSNLPHQAAFVELMHSIMNYFSNHGLIPDSIEVGNMLNLPPRVRLFRPDGSAVGQLTDTSQAQQHALTEPGIYTLVEPNRDRALIVTLNPVESDIAPMSQEASDAWQSRTLSGENATLEATASLSTQATTIRQDLWQYLLPLFAVLLLLESVLANRHLAIKRDGSL